MLRRLILSAAMAAGCVGVARAADKDVVQSALQKLADSPNYTWKSSTEGGGGPGGGTTDGKTQKDGLTTLSITRGDNTFEIVMQGDKAAAKTDDGWKSISELKAAAGAGGAGGGGGAPAPERMLAMQIQGFKTPVATAQAVLEKLDTVKREDDAYTADLSEDEAKKMLTMRGRRPNANTGPTISNAKASVKVWIKDGVVTKMENHVSGTVSFNGNDRDVDRTTTIDFTDIGSTVIKIPDEAKAKLTAAPATQP